jgi:hypothetical protein
MPNNAPSGGGEPTWIWCYSHEGRSPGPALWENPHESDVIFTWRRLHRSCRVRRGKTHMNLMLFSQDCEEVGDSGETHMNLMLFSRLTRWNWKIVPVEKPTWIWCYSHRHVCIIGRVSDDCGETHMNLMLFSQDCEEVGDSGETHMNLMLFSRKNARIGNSNTGMWRNPHESDVILTTNWWRFQTWIWLWRNPHESDVILTMI